MHTAADPALDAIINEAMVNGGIPGIVLFFGRGDVVVCRNAYGYAVLKPRPRLATETTLFDLASLTKPVGCATAIMLLSEQGRISLDDSVARYLPDFGTHGKDSITIAHMLLHVSGLPSGNPLTHYEDGKRAALKGIFGLDLTARPGEVFQYSDLGYIILGELVSAVDLRGLARFVREEIFIPLEMSDTWYKPPREFRYRCAATTLSGGTSQCGKVHDPRARALGGASGHAGLFSTVDDLARFCRMILRCGVGNKRRLLADATVTEMTVPRPIPGGQLRSYAFDVATEHSNAWSCSYAKGVTFGHTGFTGTMLWINPRDNCFLVLLTNAVHTSSHNAVRTLRARIINWVLNSKI